MAARFKLAHRQGIFPPPPPAPCHYPSQAVSMTGCIPPGMAANFVILIFFSKDRLKMPLVPKR